MAQQDARVTHTRRFTAGTENRFPHHRTCEEQPLLALEVDPDPSSSSGRKAASQSGGHPPAVQSGRQLTPCAGATHSGQAQTGRERPAHPGATAELVPTPTGRQTGGGESNTRGRGGSLRILPAPVSVPFQGKPSSENFVQATTRRPGLRWPRSHTTSRAFLRGRHGAQEGLGWGSSEDRGWLRRTHRMVSMIS